MWHETKTQLGCSCPNLHFPHLAESAQKFQNVVALDLRMCTEFGQNKLGFAGVIPERLMFSDPQSEYNVGLEPTFITDSFVDTYISIVFMLSW